MGALKNAYQEEIIAESYRQEGRQQVMGKMKALPTHPPTLIDDLKASIFVESFLNKIRDMKPKMPAETYRKVTQRLAELDKAIEMEDYFGNPAERIAHGCHPITGHVLTCECQDCVDQHWDETQTALEF